MNLYGENVHLKENRQYFLNEKKMFQKEKRHSSVFLKAFQISRKYFSCHMHFGSNFPTIPPPPPRPKFRKAWETFFIQKGRKFNYDGLNSREETFLLFILLCQFIIFKFHGMFIINLHCQIVLRISGNMLHNPSQM